MKTILVTEDRSVLTIKMNRPDVRNAISSEMIGELTEAFQMAHARDDLRAICLRGEGKAFCAGADLNYMQKMSGFSYDENLADAQNLHSMFESIHNCQMPVVSAVHGSVFGGALGLIAASDIVIAEEKTKYCFSEVRLGLVPAVISDFVMRKTSLGQASAWMLTGQVFDSHTARGMGLVHFVTEADEFEDRIEACLQSFREAGPEAVRETKRLLHEILWMERKEVAMETSRSIAQRRVSPEGKEGMKAFFEKRNATWRLQ